jgi:hypothetical protein
MGAREHGLFYLKVFLLWSFSFVFLQNVPNDVPLNNFQAQFNEGLMVMFYGYHPDAFWKKKTDEADQVDDHEGTNGHHMVAEPIRKQIAVEEIEETDTRQQLLDREAEIASYAAKHITTSQLPTGWRHVAAQSRDDDGPQQQDLLHDAYFLGTQNSNASSLFFVEDGSFHNAPSMSTECDDDDALDRPPRVVATRVVETERDY